MRQTPSPAGFRAERRGVLLALPALLAARPGATQPAPARRRVLATFTVLADMAREVAGDAALVESLTRPGAEIHDYEPTPGDVARAANAELILWNGMGLERWFERFFSRVSGVRQAVLTEGVAPIPVGEGPYARQPNPHAWMSPTDALRYVENIGAPCRTSIRRTPRPTPATPMPMPPASGRWTPASANASRRSPRTAASSRPARAPSPISPAITACARPISGR